jgi:hypothetical protein
MVCLKTETMRHGQRADLATAIDAELRLLSEPEPEAPVITCAEAAALMGASPRFVAEAQELTRDRPRQPAAR